MCGFSSIPMTRKSTVKTANPMSCTFFRPHLSMTENVAQYPRMSPTPENSMLARHRLMKSWKIAPGDIDGGIDLLQVTACSATPMEQKNLSVFRPTP